jgi:hypothetical protein
MRKVCLPNNLRNKPANLAQTLEMTITRSKIYFYTLLIPHEFFYHYNLDLKSKKKLTLPLWVAVLTIKRIIKSIQIPELFTIQMLKAAAWCRTAVNQNN